MTMLALEAISRTFGETKAIDAVDLTVAEGEFLCLLGPSGCGKSTLLRIVAGLADAGAGRVTIDGADVTRVPANRRPTAMVFQSHALWPHMSVERNIGFGLRVRGVPGEEQRRRIAAVLDLVGLAGFGRRYPAQMSGGQAQRVALARCLVVEPRILLMDEPFSALDAHLRQRLREDLKRLQRRLGLTTVFVTHDQDEAMELADRIAVMQAGRIEQVDAPGELYRTPATLHVARFIGSMNETVLELRGGRAAWHGADLALDAPDGAYRALCRPEDLTPDRAGAALTPERTIDLGASLRVHLAAGDGARLVWAAGREDMPAASGPVTLRPRRLLLYRDGALAAACHPAIAPPLLRQTA